MEEFHRSHLVNVIESEATMFLGVGPNSTKSLSASFSLVARSLTIWRDLFQPVVPFFF